MFSKAVRRTSSGGAVVPHQKNTAEQETVVMKSPKKVRILMAQHIGAPCEPVVAVGDKVKIGQVIGNTEGFVAAPIHASIAGTVAEIGDFTHPNGRTVKGVVIENDGTDTVHESVKPHPVSTPADLIALVKEAGLVGLGGAGFPTSIKLAPKNPDEIDSIVINGAECEPFLTCDYREMMENTDSIVHGIRELMTLFPKATVYFGIESNKPKAIQKFEDAFKADSNIEVVSLRARYPQGAEKVLIYECIGRELPEGGLPADIGVVILNTTTVSTISKFIQTGMPVTQRRITVDGSAVASPKNVIVPIGTMLSDIIEFTGGYKGKPGKFLLGGPMMGNAIPSDDYSTMKTTNGIVVFDEAESDTHAGQTNCMKCGNCAEACPIHLLPAGFEHAADKKNVKGLRLLNVSLCMECGSCAYVCPAKRDLVAKIRIGKGLLVADKK